MKHITLCAENKLKKLLQKNLLADEKGNKIPHWLGVQLIKDVKEGNVKVEFHQGNTIKIIIVPNVN